MHSLTKPPPTATPLRPRQEKFCQSFVSLGNASNAAREAGYLSGAARQQGWRLMKTQRIRARIGEIQAQMAHDHCRDRDMLIGKLEVVYRRALENRHFAAAARAVEMQAKLTRATPTAEPSAQPQPDHQEQGGTARIIKM
ncbi:MAG: terminase small subunit [Proteobacteria bacterium]|nr:terminase small subunit [Pseudomonadota bacterium]